MAENPYNEYASLIGDLKEQLLYLRELGVENLDVDLPELDAKFQNAAGAPILKLKTEDRKPNLERFVPETPIVAPPSTAKPEQPVAKSEEQQQNMTVRQSLLEKSKLSRLPSLTKRERTVSDFHPAENRQISEPAKSDIMPKQKTTAEENQSQSLFGDITQSLPDSNETLEEIRLDVGNCTRCPLWEGRTKIVHSEGNPNADLVFVGEAPGANEDAEGRPFVGKAGQLLNKIIEAIGMKREDVFIGNINRCRPPGNRTPTLPEAHTCRPFLLREIAVIRPKVVVVLGNTATQNLLDTKVGITKLRGEFQDYYGIKVMPTFHPAYLLRDPTKKRETWEDMKKVRDELNKLKD
ncbi:MAG: uracil-DNA glycosylase [Acidobacteriota bacterium]|nr:uracil-DNA glycosylase [Acidobacteriota bacterium]